MYTILFHIFVESLRFARYDRGFFCSGWYEHLDEMPNKTSRGSIFGRQAPLMRAIRTEYAHGCILTLEIGLASAWPEAVLLNGDAIEDPRSTSEAVSSRASSLVPKARTDDRRRMLELRHLSSLAADGSSDCHAVRRLSISLCRRDSKHFVRRLKLAMSTLFS